MFIAESPLIGCWVQAYFKHNFPTSTIDCCTVSGHAPIFHLLTGHLLTDICWLDICWLGLDICWLRHLLILATPAICWLWKDVCWFRHLLIQTIADSVKTHISAFTTAATFPKLPISGTMEVDYINQACHLDIFMKSHENLRRKN